MDYFDQGDLRLKGMLLKVSLWLFKIWTSPGSGENSVHTIRKGRKHGLFSMTCFLLLAHLGVQPWGGFSLYPWHPNVHRVQEF